MTLRVHGELDSATAPHLADVMADLIDPTLRDVTVDLTDLDFVDVRGLRTLNAFRVSVTSSGAGFRLVAVPAPVGRVMGLAGFAELRAAVTGTVPA